MDEFIGLFQIIPVTEEIARQGGRYKGLYHKSHGVGLADGLIAATAVLHNLDLPSNLKFYVFISSRYILGVFHNPGRKRASYFLINPRLRAGYNA